MRRAMAGFAFVVSSNIMRGIITAIMWIKPPSVPNAVFTEIDEAIECGFERLHESGIQISHTNYDDARRVFGMRTFRGMTARR